MLERYTTEAVAPAQRIRRWCDFGSSTLSHMTVRPYRPERFTARLVRATLADLGITHMSSSAAVAESDDGRVGEWAGSPGGALAITLYRRGSPRLTQGGRTLQLLPGDIVIRDLHRPWRQDSSGDFALMTVKVAAPRAPDLYPQLRALVMRPLRADDPRTALLASLIENLGRLAFEGRVAPARDVVQRLLHDTLELASPKGADDDPPPAPALPARLVRYLAPRLHDPELNLAGMARDLGLHPRSLQRLFQQAGTTPTAWILARRLELAAERLRERGRAGRTRVIDVALAAGFNDPGYFARVFQREFGVTPTQYRRRHDGED